MASLADRFWAKVRLSEGCWEWTGSRTLGYGQIRSDGQARYAHRISWEMHVGPIPKGKQLDHICRNRACVRPSHLRVVDNKQNNENHGGARANSRSGIRGVWQRDSGAWVAQVKHNRKVVFNAQFATAQEAERAVVEARNRIHTHNIRDRHVTV